VLQQSQLRSAAFAQNVIVDVVQSDQRNFTQYRCPPERIQVTAKSRRRRFSRFAFSKFAERQAKRIGPAKSASVQEF
jgi:hypothetical protein